VKLKKGLQNVNKLSRIFAFFSLSDRFFGKSELLQSQILEIEKKFVKLKGDFHFHEIFAIFAKTCWDTLQICLQNQKNLEGKYGRIFQKALALISFGIIIILDGSLETIYKIFMNISQFFFSTAKWGWDYWDRCLVDLSPKSSP
jgi:hypothetical protein